MDGANLSKFSCLNEISELTHLFNHPVLHLSSLRERSHLEVVGNAQ